MESEATTIREVLGFIVLVNGATQNRSLLL